MKKGKSPGAKVTSRPVPEVGQPHEPVKKASQRRSTRSARDIALLDQMLFSHVRKGDASRLSHAVARGADVNVQDRHRMTPLHHAAALGERACVRVLVNSRRCDYLARDSQGRYAFELAIEWARDHAVGRLLAKKQAQQAAEQDVPAYVPRS